MPHWGGESATLISFNEEFKRRLVNALTDGHVTVISYVDRNGEPHSSFYGSLHAHSGDQVAFWARNPDSELRAIIEEKPVLAFAYADVGTRTFYRFKGTARLVEDDATRNRIFEGMHPFEQSQDPNRDGAAILVDVTYWAGRDESGLFEHKQ